MRRVTQALGPRWSRGDSEKWLQPGYLQQARSTGDLCAGCQGWREPAPHGTGGIKVQRSLKGSSASREGRQLAEQKENSLQASVWDPLLRSVTFLFKQFFFTVEEASSSLFKPLPFLSGHVWALVETLQTSPSLTIKDLISLPSISLYKLKSPFHFTELCPIPFIFSFFFFKFPLRNTRSRTYTSKKVERQRKRLHPTVGLHLTGFQSSWLSSQSSPWLLKPKVMTSIS